MSRRINDEYFEWLFDLVCTRGYSRNTHRKLLIHLHDIEFRYSIPKDRNRAEYGEDLRYRFAIDRDYDIPTTLNDLGKPCSVLEMMIALAVTCEEHIMDNPDYGNRTGQWFWGMITNMGLNTMTDAMYDEAYVNTVVDRLLNRKYDPDGKGGLFRIRDCGADLRKVDIWRQLCWYLDTIT